MTCLLFPVKSLRRCHVLRHIQSLKCVCAHEQGFVQDCDVLFAGLRELQRDGESSDGDGAAAMAATLEIIRKHEVRPPASHRGRLRS